MTRRTEKVNELIKKELSKILREHFNPKEALVTVSYVKTAPDLKSAKAYISIFPFSEAEKILKELKENFSKFQLILGETVKLKYLPKIALELDESLEYEDKIEGLIREIKSGKMRRS